MPHIHTNKNEHDLTVTAYIIRTDTPEPRALLHMHRKIGLLLPVGGHVETTETPWQAVAHEVAEEAGYDFEQLKVLQPKQRITSLSKVVLHPNPVSMNTHNVSDEHSHTDIQYAFIVKSDPARAVHEGESSDIRWLTRAELNELGPDLIYENTKEVYSFIFDEVLSCWEAVPANTYS